MKMNQNLWQKTGSYLLFACNIFVLFLLVAGSRVIVPSWLQVAGRMHPLLLHFPIVLMIISTLLVFIRLREPAANKWKEQLTGILLLAGALSAAVTVIMGLFLYREEGYAANGALFWHKWGGILVLWAASACYWLSGSHRRWLLKSGAVVATALLLVTGHLGADITHGDNFVLAPVMPASHAPEVPLEKALVYEHVIRPILQEKCMSCHNAGKAKGGLSMEQPDKLLAGGRSGKLLIAGNPVASLLMIRIHLAAEDKKHMPPVGKPQLTDEETALLYHWIKGGADMKKMVAALPAHDSLRLLASARLQPSEAKEPVYDFSPADEKLVQQLSNNYRVLYPIAMHAAPLVANWYNKDKFNITSVRELLPVKEQLIEMHLQKMPVADADLEVLSQFHQLRVLNLSFTNITGKTLSALAKLPHLQSLSLSGTPVSLSHLAVLKTAPALKELYVWNTSLSESDLQQAQKSFSHVTLVKGFISDNKEQLKLSQPVLLNTTAVFRSSMQLLLKHSIKGVEIRYTTDGSIPDSIHSPVFKDSLLLTGNTTIRAIACKQGWNASDPVQFSFSKTTYTPDSVVLLNQPDGAYAGNGPKTLTDEQKGGMDYNNGKWLGYSKKALEAELVFLRTVPVKSVSINTFRNIGAHIFPPQKIEVWGGPDKQHLRLLKRMVPEQGKKDDPNAAITFDCSFAPVQVSCMKIVLTPVASLPPWHPGKGNHGWVFVDEVMFN
ncbi:MAG TPA: FN3 associated domain-containing protein [Chitinophaga sp.]|uniref:FN3 associated domain-containing protein n=1 Tax=Chitinophaga sp. TaxID=1869181 RepID=UPI002CF6DF1C|nr:FN3 associated domain-containing protein [Chitinophaga sp.]HVI45556.1 FN3 associated domain-containing protein [Chitinophaga sp.]